MQTEPIQDKNDLEFWSLCVQTSIRAEGFRSLREGEQVEYDLEVGDDGRGRAINVTGPQGAPPQVSPKSLY